jgi:hypothetical protein
MASSSSSKIPTFHSKLAVEVYPDGGHRYDPEDVAGADHLTDVQHRQALAIIDDVVRVERRRFLYGRRRFVRSQVTISNEKPRLLLHVALVLRKTETCFGCC